MSLGWSSAWDGHDRAPLRIGIAVIAGLELLVECLQVGWQSRDPARFPPTGTLSEWLGAIPGAALGIEAMILVGLVALARDRRPVIAGLWVLLWGALLSEWQTQIFASPSRNAFFPGAAMLGWVLGQAWAHETADLRDEAAPRALREQLGEAGAVACIAAAYLGSCLSKLGAAGLGWADGDQIRALVLWQQPLASWEWLAAYREGILRVPALARAASFATLVIEGGALLLLFGPRLRLAWATLLVGLHLNIILLCTMPYLEPMALLGLLAVPWPRLLRRPAKVSADEESPPSLDGVRMPPAMALWLGGIVLLAWILAPWGWRARP